MPTESLGISDLEAFGCAIWGFVVGCAVAIATIAAFARGRTDWEMYALCAAAVVVWVLVANGVAYAIYVRIFRARSGAA